MKINRLSQKVLLPGALGILMLLCNGSMTAQRTAVFAQHDTVSLVSDTVVVTVRGVNFDSIVAVSFTMNWDSSVLEFAGIRERELAGSNDFSVLEAAGGRLGFVGVDNSLQGYGLRDSAVLFRVNFLLVTTVSTATEISFSDAPTRRFISRFPNDRVMDAEYGTGTLLLEGVTSLRVVHNDPAFRVHPNPIVDVSQIEVTLAYSSPAMLDVVDAGGRTLSRRSVAVRPGRNTYGLTATDLPKPGAYVLRLTTDRERWTRKVIRR